MSILYSCVGASDPTRNYKDGPLLHIVRYYKPRKVVLFLSKEMAINEAERNLYTKPIKMLSPDCEIKTIATEITAAHQLDPLQPIIDHFYELLDETVALNPDEEILLNLTSGTPQMQIIMATLSSKISNAIGVQVDSPVKKSNDGGHIGPNDTPEDLMACNEDNDEGAENRCHEPSLRYIRKNLINEKIEAFIDSYNYEAALIVYKENKQIYHSEIGKLLEHANLREKFMYKKACEKIKKIGELNLCNRYEKEFGNLWEYLLIMNIRIHQKNYQDFFVRLTPFLYELFYEYLFKVLRVPVNSLGEKIGGISSKHVKVKRDKLEKNYPKTLKVLDSNHAYIFSDRDLSFYILKELLSTEEKFKVPNEFKKILIQLRNIESSLRNELAHNIKVLSIDDVKSASGGMTPSDICALLYKVFFFVTGKDYGREALVYNAINKKIKELMLDEVEK